MADKKDKRALGRGLSALMADIEAKPEDIKAAPAPSSGVMMAPIEKVFRNKYQPRKDFNEEDLQDLANSIKERGVIQPIIVRKKPPLKAGGEYEIIAGERRWRAAQIAQLHELPIILREMDDKEVLEVAIIENIQRADLNPVEEAEGYQQLAMKYGHTQEQLSLVLGKSRSHIANMLRLCELPQSVLEHLRSGALSVGHGRALVPYENAAEIADVVVARSLSVRDTEKLAKNGLTKKISHFPKQKAEKDADTKALEADLKAHLGMRVQIEHKGDDFGVLSVAYTSLDDLDRLCGILTNPGASK